MVKNNAGLTNTQINAAKAKDKLYTLYDVTGLRLLIRPSGRKVWTFNYTRPTGKKTSITIGDYPTITIAQAREFAREKRGILSTGADLFNENTKKTPTLNANKNRRDYTSSHFKFVADLKNKKFS